MFSIISKVNSILNLFHKEIYEMFSARKKIITKNIILMKNIAVLGAKNISTNGIKI